MTINTETAKHTYSGTGSQTDFSVTFPILDETHLLVQIKDTNGDITDQVITTNYTVSGSNNTEGSTDYQTSTIAFVAAPASTDTVIILRDVPKTQTTDYKENERFSAETTEDGLDKTIMAVQELNEKSDRSIKLDAAESSLNDAVIKGTLAAGKVIQVDSGGDDLEFVALADLSLGSLLDEDDLVSDSDTDGATQQSIKAYVDSQAAATSIEVDGSAVSTNSPTLDFDGTDFTLSESPTDDFDITINAERIQDITGAMVTGNTETGITVVYQDGDGTLDFTVSDTTVAGDSGSMGITPGDTLTIAGGTNATTSMSGDTLTINVDDAFLSNSGDTGTGTYTITGDVSVDNININGNVISSTDTNGDISLTPDGSGNVNIGNFGLDADQTVGAGQDNYVLTYDDGTGLISLEAAPGAGGGDSWGDAVDADIVPDADGTRDLGSSANRFAELHIDSMEIAGSSTMTGFTGVDTDIVSGTSGGTNEVAQWNSDGDLVTTSIASTNLSVKNQAQEYTGTQNFNMTTVSSSGGALTWLLSSNQVAKLTLSENTTLNAPTGQVAGCTYILIVVQDSTPRTITFNSVFKFPGGTAPTISTGSGDVDILSFVSDGTNMYGTAVQDMS